MKRILGCILITSFLMIGFDHAINAMEKPNPSHEQLRAISARANFYGSRQISIRKPGGKNLPPKLQGTPYQLRDGQLFYENQKKSISLNELMKEKGVRIEDIFVRRFDGGYDSIQQIIKKEGLQLDIAAIEVSKELSPAMREQRARSRSAQAAIKFEFANQSDQFVMVWITKVEGCWYPTRIYPNKDSGILTPIDIWSKIYIYTKAKGYFEMEMSNLISDFEKKRGGFTSDYYYYLVHFRPGYEATGSYTAIENINAMPYEEAQDIVVVINPDGSVNFSKRNP